MYHILQGRDLKKGAIAAVEFEGDRYGAGVSFFLGNLMPGQGPGLHTHPYAETCLVLAGQVRLCVDGDEFEGRAGDVVVIGANSPHSLTAAGEEQLDMVCIHASDHFEIDWLEDR